MSYGLRTDAAFLPIGRRPMRSDQSCTLFISDPKDYQGGELAIQLGTRTLTFKGPAGTAVVFRTSTQPLGASSIQNDAAGSG